MLQPKNASDICNYVKTPSLLWPYLSLVSQIPSQTITGLFASSHRIKVYQIFIRDQISPKKQDDTMCPILEGLFWQEAEDNDRICPDAPPQNNGRKGPIRDQATDANSDPSGRLWANSRLPAHYSQDNELTLSSTTIGEPPSRLHLQNWTQPYITLDYSERHLNFCDFCVFFT